MRSPHISAYGWIGYHSRFEAFEDEFELEWVKQPLCLLR